MEPPSYLARQLDRRLGPWGYGPQASHVARCRVGAGFGGLNKSNQKLFPASLQAPNPKQALSTLSLHEALGAMDWKNT